MNISTLLYGLILVGLLVLLLLACVYFAMHQKFPRQRTGPASDVMWMGGNGPALDVAAQLEKTLSSSTQRSRRHKQRQRRQQEKGF